MRSYSQVALQLCEIMTEQTEAHNSARVVGGDVSIKFEVDIDKLYKENCDLKEKLLETEKMLEMERSKFSWQCKLYENRIAQLESGNNSLTSISTMECGPTSTLETEIHNSIKDSLQLMSLQSKYRRIDSLLSKNKFSKHTTHLLHLLQKSQTEELENLQKSYEQQLDKMSLKHEADIAKILESSQIEVKRLTTEHERILSNLMLEYTDAFERLKSEYDAVVLLNKEYASNQCANQVIRQFEVLPAAVQTVIIASITALHYSTAGWATWGFVMWVWPKLVTFSELLSANKKTLMQACSYASSSADFVRSVPFRNFVRSWKQGKTLVDCLQDVHNTDLYLSAIRLAPDIFLEFQKYKKSYK